MAFAARRTISLFDTDIDVLRMDEAVDAVTRLVEDGGHHLVVTPNVDHLMWLREDRELVAAYRHASLTLADGVPVVWASRLLGRPLPERICGTDLLAPLFRRAEDRAWRVFIQGGSRHAAVEARASVSAGFPRLVLAGLYAPPIGFEHSAEEVEKTIAAIRRARPNLLLVALGCPKQEVFVWRHRHALEGIVALGIGSGIAYLLGWKRRAPLWMRRAGLEWFYRLLREPRRLAHRYLVRDLRFLPLLFSTWARERKARDKP